MRAVKPGALLLTASLVSGCSGPASDAGCAGLLRLDPGVAEADARAALEAGDDRLLGVYGSISLMAPGVAHRLDDKVRALSGARETGPCGEHYQRVYTYASRYNRVIEAAWSEGRADAEVQRE